MLCIALDRQQDKHASNLYDERSNVVFLKYGRVIGATVGESGSVVVDVLHIEYDDTTTRSARSTAATTTPAQQLQQQQLLLLLTIQ